jgi:hypothetical protein
MEHGEMSNDDMVRAPFRLAIRQEGELINAYVASNETMEGAMLLGSMRKRICEIDGEIFDLFKMLMQAALAAVSKDAVGIDIAFVGEEPAPEHERSGNA